MSTPAMYERKLAEIAALEARLASAEKLAEAEAAVSEELETRLREAEALLREAIPAVQSYARKHGRAVVAAARRNDADRVAKHADIEKSAWGLADRIRAFLSPDSTTPRENDSHD